MLLPAVILILLGILVVLVVAVAFLLWNAFSGQERPEAEHKQQQEDEHAL